MKAVPKMTTTPLEAARLRIRNRFLTKFPSAQRIGSAVVATATPNDSAVPPPLRGNNESSPLLAATTGMPHLEAARARLRTRFQEKFPVAQSLEMHSTTTRPLESMDDPQKENYVEEARQRISKRFQQTFRPDFEGFPHTLDQAVAHLDDNDFGETNAVIITGAAPSFHILAVNSTWERLCGYSRAEAVGKTLKELGFHGAMTNKASTRALTRDLELGKSTALRLTNQTKEGRIFTNYLRVAPLFDEDDVRSTAPAIAFLGVVQDASSSKPQQVHA